MQRTTTLDKATTQQTAKNKSLQWAPTCIEYSIIHITDMSEQEIRSTWYDSNDYRAFRKDCRDTIHMLQSSKTIQNSMKHILCQRGLEKRIDAETGYLRNKRRQLAIAIVLEEQADQKECGIISTDLLSELYQEVSEPSIYLAYLQGLQDQQDALSPRPQRSIRRYASSHSRKNDRPLLPQRRNSARLIKSMT